MTSQLGRLFIPISERGKRMALGSRFMMTSFNSRLPRFSHARFSHRSGVYPNERVETGESNDSRANQSTIFSVGGWWIFWQPLLNVGHGYPALGALSRPSTEGTTDVCVVAETMGG